MIISFHQWLIERIEGPGSGMPPTPEPILDPKQTQAMTHAHGPDSPERPPTPERKEILKSKKKMKKAK